MLSFHHHSKTQMVKIEEPIDFHTLRVVNRTSTTDSASEAEKYIKQESIDLESVSSATNSPDNSEMQPIQPTKKMRISSVPQISVPIKRTIQTRQFSIDDFQSEENKRIYQELNTRTQSFQKAINVLQRKRRFLDAKILRLRTTIKVITDNCGNLPVDAKKLDDICDSDGSSDSDCSSNSDVETIEANVDIFNTAEFILAEQGEGRHRTNESKNIDDLTNEDQSLSFCNFTFANQVQLTFSSHTENQEFKKLQKKIAWTADRDVTLSREIYQLKNRVFMQDKKIEEMKRNLTKIKRENN
ncbi:serine--tRNA ligase, cytoplasmic-like isoform X2 [Euwallacea fornicatus]|uniref:serine--tRNA ligase, cytoplasmic-like isoform X2 n=1 Tax=Euwallacea fornicatus TaxID=995702 RepID=UPI00338D4517